MVRVGDVYYEAHLDPARSPAVEVEEWVVRTIQRQRRRRYPGLPDLYGPGLPTVYLILRNQWTWGPSGWRAPIPTWCRRKYLLGEMPGPLSKSRLAALRALLRSVERDGMVDYACSEAAWKSALAQLRGAITRAARAPKLKRQRTRR